MSDGNPIPARKLKLALGQQLVVGADVEGNLARAEAQIAAAAAQGCDLIVLPECLDVGWTDPSARTLAEPIPGPRVTQLSAAARRNRIFVATGLTERAGGQIYNAAVLLDDAGQLLLCHRKINELDFAQDLYGIGDRLQVAHTRLGTLAVNICADNFPNALDLGSALGRMGAQILLSPSSWAVDDSFEATGEPYGGLWRTAYGELSGRFRMPVAGVSNVGVIRGGPWAGRRCIGSSLVFDAHGQEVVTGPCFEPALLVTEVAIYTGRPRGTAISGSL